MNLEKTSIFQIPVSPGLVLPGKDTLLLPEKVLQFGTGVLLRALPDFIINNANNKGVFNGRIVMVKSTTNGSADSFEKQDGLYSVCVRGIAEGRKVEETHIIASISRVLSASTEWNKILECASNPEMQVIISNTTEVGIVLVKDNIHADPPQSFPGKLLSFLYHRFKYFKGDPGKGMVIIPTELVPLNGEKLLSIILELAHINNLEGAFLDWLENSNYFCNSLVDRIVPGKLNEADHKKMEEKIGYKDDLLIMSEVYSLWAIQSGNEKVKKILSFAINGNGVVIAPDINKFRELKLRLLNAPHTFSCGIAYLAGFDTVKKGMDNTDFSTYLKELMFEEIIPSVIDDYITLSEAEAFANTVLDRYRNSFIEHSWLSITLQYSTKMYLRNIALIENYTSRFGQAPVYMAVGMAGHILFMHVSKNGDGNYYGEINGEKYEVKDDNAKYYAKAWKENQPDALVNKILSDRIMWGSDLTLLNGFEMEVAGWLKIMMEKGILFALKEAAKKKSELVNEK
ncbi:MAG TPA: tagaturonate reductase [Ferruginibacter sp.]|nr:tagaturonate reductase [Ferruginibacter sp.]